MQTARNLGALILIISYRRSFSAVFFEIHPESSDSDQNNTGQPLPEHTGYIEYMYLSQHLPKSHT